MAEIQQKSMDHTYGPYAMSSSEKLKFMDHTYGP